MSGNLWMFSDKLDDEDIEIMKHEFITYYQGADYYGLGLKMFTRLAHEAGAVYKIGKKVLAVSYRANGIVACHRWKRGVHKAGNACTGHR